jgi:hypothetical protein
MFSLYLGSEVPIYHERALRDRKADSSQVGGFDCSRHSHAG